MGLMTHGTCVVKKKLVIKFLNGTADAKIQNPVLVTYINFYVGTCDVN